MNLGQAGAVALLLCAPLAAGASGFRPPAHSALNYVFTCPSGASGHVAYTQDFTAARATRLAIWVNGRYVQDDPDVAPALRATNVEQAQAECEGDRTVIVLTLFRNDAPDGRPLRRVVIHVDRTGNATVDDR